MTMSTLKVEVVKVDDVIAHPNADRLEIAVIKGWNCVVSKGTWHNGDLGIYFPIDSVLHPGTESILFPSDSKIKLHNSRVRVTKIRGAFSQGLLVHPSSFPGIAAIHTGMDLTEATGTTKFEPAEMQQSSCGLGSRKRTKSPNPYFHKYTDIENFKNHIDLFKAGDAVVIHEKIHGTNFRAGWVPFHADTWWKKTLAFFGLTPPWEFVFGSHNVQLQNKPFWQKGYYSKNVYAEAVNRYDLKRIIPKGFVVYGEIFGIGIQKDYAYGRVSIEATPRALVLFDVKSISDNRYLDFYEALIFIRSMGLNTPPEIFCGLYKDQQELKKWVTGSSLLDSSQKIREGIVIRPLIESNCYLGRKILKYKSDEFLAQFEDDTH